MRLHHVLSAALLIVGLALSLALAGCALALPGGTSTTTASKTPTSSSAATFGPPATVPLPDGSSLAHQTAPSGFLAPRIWVYTVPNTDARTLEAYYSKTLPPKGWSDYQASFDKTSAGEVATITAKQDGAGLQITISPGPTQTTTVAPPAGGVIVQISERPVGT